MKKQAITHLQEGPVGRTLFFFAVPVLLSQLLQEFYNIADCAIVGRFAGSQALAATGLAGLVLSVLINFFIGFSSGISVRISWLFGAGYYERLRRASMRILRFSALAGVVLTVAAEALAPWIFRVMNTPGETYDPALVYLRICLLGLSAQLLYNVATAILRSMGDSKAPMLLYLISSLINLFLDCVLVIGFGQGVAGAAAATMTAQWLLAAAICVYLVRLTHQPIQHRMQTDSDQTGGVRSEPDCGLRASTPEMRGQAVDPDGHPSSRTEGMAPPASSAAEALVLLRDGLPAGMQALFMSASSLMIQVFINSFGSAAVAGMTLFARAEGFLYFPAFAYGIALTGFVGQNLGAGEGGRIRKAIRLSIVVLACYVLPMSALLAATAPHFLRLFTEDAPVIAHATQAVRYILPFYLLYAVNQVLLGAIKGMGNTTWPMVCTMVCYCVFRVLWCRLLMPVHASMTVIYLSYDVSFLLMLLMLLPMWRKLRPDG